jgi:hypothetical protein
MAVASPAMLLVLPIMVYAYGRFTILYRRSSRELKRLEAISNSPVMRCAVCPTWWSHCSCSCCCTRDSHVSDTLDGLCTIRAFKTEEREVRRFIAVKDVNSRTFFAGCVAAVSCHRCFSFLLR